MEAPFPSRREPDREGVGHHYGGDDLPARRDLMLLLDAKVDALCRKIGEQAQMVTPVPFVEGDAGHHEESASQGLVEYWHILRRWKGTILLISILGALGGLLASFPQAPVYQAHTSLEIQGINENFLNMTNANPTVNTTSFLPDYEIQTQMKILQSESLLERVLNKLSKDESPAPAAPPSRLVAWRKALGLAVPSPAAERQGALGMAAGTVRARNVGQNRIVEITCDSTDPVVAATFANALTNEFIEQNLEARWNSTQRTGEWLNRQMQDLKVKLERSEEQLQAYAQASNLMFTSEKENVVEGKLKHLQDSLSAAAADRVEKQSQYELAASAPIESLPEILDSERLSEYQGKLTELQRQMAELTATLTPAHYRVKRLAAQITQMESAMKRARASVLERIRNDYEAAQRREQLLTSEYLSQTKVVSEQAGKAIHFNILKREVDTNRQLYEAMLQKVKEAGITSAMRASNIRVVDPARPPGGPYKPNVTMNAMLGLLTGVILGIAFVLVQERVDRTLRAPGDVTAYLHIPELGVIPSVQADSMKQTYGDKGRGLLLNALGRGNSNGRASDVTDSSLLDKVSNERLELITWQHKPSLLAESFRATLTSIQFSGQNGSRPRIIVLTSASPSEGKTTVVSNLAIALAEINRKVVLIDADMRKPRLHDVFGVANSWGLSDVLREKNSIADYPAEALVRPTEIPSLYLLPSGPGTVSISNLLYSARLPELLSRLRQEFDTVLIDTPPMMHISDARILGQLADAVILVLRAGHTTRDTAKAAKQRFMEDGTPILGTILNCWNPKASHNGHYGTYGYGYSDYYDEYRDYTRESQS